MLKNIFYDVRLPLAGLAVCIAAGGQDRSPEIGSKGFSPGMTVGLTDTAAGAGC